MIQANTRPVRLSALVALGFLFTGFSSFLGATEISITPIDIDKGQFEIALNEIDPVDDRVYTIKFDSDSGTAVIEFGDGVPGAIPPSGESNVVATYRHGSGGQDGTIIGIYPVVQDLLPVLIPFSDFVVGTDQEDVSFLLIGLASINFEFSREGILVIESQSRTVPESSVLALLGLGLTGLGFARKRMAA